MGFAPRRALHRPYRRAKVGRYCAVPSARMGLWAAPYIMGISTKELMRIEKTLSENHLVIDLPAADGVLFFVCSASKLT